ncbi:dim gamma-tubulin 5 [Haematobia irritans]|uniref:dim gamma-tubulin 5 n=1 Tax=Haematobia irritans TaxID=7368 RepID=UPI003F50405E
MTVEDDIEAFRIWATKLGCPQEAMPSEDALKSVFKSRQRDMFCNLMRRVRPRQDVQDIKENIVIHKTEKIKGQIVSICERSFLPHEMQVYLKMQELKKKHKDIEQSLEDRKKESEALAASIKTKNIQIANMGNKCEQLEAKVHILDFKFKALDKSLKKEEENKEKIKATMPVVLNNENKSEHRANEAVQKALNELEDFYMLCEQTKNYEVLQEAKSKIWSNMRQIFTNIPNFLIFNTILRLKEEQLQHIMSLNRTINNESNIATNSREPLTNFEMNFMKTKASFLSIVGKYLVARQEHDNMKLDFPNTYDDFEEKLLEKVKIFNSDMETEQSEEIMRNYVWEYNCFNFKKGENEYLTQQIEALKVDIEHSQKYLENHEVLLGSIKQVYSEISASVNRIQYDMMQLSQIKDKIIYSKNIMKHQLDDLEAMVTNSTMVKSNFKPTKLKITNNNMSLMGADSFEMSNDNVFCSTKLDFDSTMSSLNNTTLRRSFGGGNDLTLMPPQAQNTILPSHTLELTTFCETPMHHLSCLSKESSFYLSPNPLITETSELSSTVQLAPGVLLTPFGALQEVRNRILWADLIAQHSNDLKLNLDTFLVDPQQYKLKAKQQHDRIIEILDKIDVCSVNTLHSLQKLAKIYDFLIENPLRHFIPPSKTYNNQSYADYEGELVMYTRIATTGNSIK